MPHLFPAADSSYILATVLLGANDSVHSSESQHVPISEYKGAQWSCIMF